MAPTYRTERDRGSKEFAQQLAVLRESRCRRPLASPPSDDSADSLNAVMLAKLGAPAASAQNELFPRPRPPRAEAWDAFVRSRPAADEDLA